VYFVGRERETARVIKALDQRRNIVLTGKYGMGRTSLVRYVAEATEKRWRFLFVDFSKTPARICNELLAALTPERNPKDHPVYIRYKAARFFVAKVEFGDKPQPVIVLDNIRKLSTQRVAFIRYLAWNRRFLFIALPENFLPEADVSHLRTVLYPSDLVRLGKLGAKPAADFFRHFSDKHRFQWTRSHIRMLVTASRGYPLGMKDFVKDELQRQSKNDVTQATTWE
jgi:hypothetical protein